MYVYSQIEMRQKQNQYRNHRKKFLSNLGLFHKSIAMSEFFYIFYFNNFRRRNENFK